MSPRQASVGLLALTLLSAAPRAAAQAPADTLRGAGIATVSADRGHLLVPAVRGTQEARASGARLRPLAAAKWALLAAAAGTATWGVLETRQADRAYEALEARCAANEQACHARLDSGAYADPDLEGAYQDVVRRDRSAGRALLAGQVGFAASVVLFVLDLRHAGAPDDIPYDPSLRLEPTGDGAVRLGLRLSLPLR